MKQSNQIIFKKKNYKPTERWRDSHYDRQCHSDRQLIEKEKKLGFWVLVIGDRRRKEQNEKKAMMKKMVNTNEEEEEKLKGLCFSFHFMWIY